MVGKRGWRRGLKGGLEAKYARGPMFFLSRYKTTKRLENMEGVVPARDISRRYTGAPLYLIGLFV